MLSTKACTTTQHECVSSHHQLQARPRMVCANKATVPAKRLAACRPTCNEQISRWTIHRSWFERSSVRGRWERGRALKRPAARTQAACSGRLRSSSSSGARTLRPAATYTLLVGDNSTWHAITRGPGPRLTHYYVTHWFLYSNWFLYNKPLKRP